MIAEESKTALVQGGESHRLWRCQAVAMEGTREERVAG
jgi:hypothetical protein